jgi:hypothetical protein
MLIFIFLKVESSFSRQLQNTKLPQTLLISMLAHIKREVNKKTKNKNNNEIKIKFRYPGRDTGTQQF